jgi:hypothetical protein
MMIFIPLFASWPFVGVGLLIYGVGHIIGYLHAKINSRRSGGW